MNNNQANGPQYDNLGFQHQGKTPPTYSPQPTIHPYLPQQTPGYVATGAPPTINTFHISSPRTPPSTRQRKRSNTCNCKCILCISLSVLLGLALAAFLVWYFVFNQCQGKPCGHDDSGSDSDSGSGSGSDSGSGSGSGSDGECVASQWCDGVRDCSDGEDESRCFRLHGAGFMLEGYSASNQEWLPVCAENWDDNYGRAVCEQMGYDRQDYVSYNQTSAGSLASNGYMKLKNGSMYGPHVQSQLTYSQTCSAHAVTLKCIECGKSLATPSARIVGGTDAVSGAWPWQVSLQTNDWFYRHVCGGSIITPQWILSSVRCTSSVSSLFGLSAFAGQEKMHFLMYGVRVEKAIIHPNYSSETNDNDIALLKLRTRLDLSKKLGPVCLPNIGMPITSPGTQAWITGWGARESSGRWPYGLLQQANVTIYSRETCNAPNILDGQVTQSMICAGKLEGGVDFCEGDRGGPLVVQVGDVWFLAGDTSWGNGCGLKNKPGVYGNVPYFIDWIYEQMQKNP